MRSCLHTLAFVSVLMAFSGALTAQNDAPEPKTMVFIDEGTAAAAQYMGGAWTPGEGYTEAKGTQNLYQRILGNCVVGEGDFTVTARMAITNLARSAADFAIGDDSYFGFAGGHGKIYITGPFFDNAAGTPVGEPTDFMQDGQPFDFEAKRAGDHFTVTIDGKLVHERTVTTGPIGPVGFIPYRSTMRIYSFAATGNLGPYKAPRVPGAAENIALDPRVTYFPELPQGPFVRLGDGSIMGVDDRDALISTDEGNTWERRPIFTEEQKMRIRPERALLRTRDGAIILIFSNEAVRHYSWDKENNVPLPDMLLPTYAVRSLDEGKTWVDLTLLDNGWNGCIQDIIQTSDGTVVVPGQQLLYKEGRHATIPYVSKDDGKTWTQTRFLDIGGKGDHAGAIEGTLEELTDGRLWLLMRSAHGFFYESFSEDMGLTWSDQNPSAIKATSAPGKMKRLASGRLVLLWNAIPAEGFKTREQLCISFSEDDGKTWTPPQVVATNPGGRVSYPYVFEQAPGTLWITTMQGKLRIALPEEEFAKP